MNLYYICQGTNRDYDTYDGAVVAAESSEKAKLIHPSPFNLRWVYNEWRDLSGQPAFNNHNWTTPENVMVALIGVASKNIKEGVICASFNAG